GVLCIARTGFLRLRPLLARIVTGIGLVVVRLAAVGRLLPVATAARRRRRRLALHRILDNLAIGDRVLHAGLQAQGFVVGGNRVLVAPGAGECIAAVVRGIDTGQLVPGLRGGGVVLAPVGVGAVLHAFVPDLVGPAPRRALVGGQRRVPGQAGTQEQGRNGAAAAPEREQRQRHQRQQQPVTVVAPGDRPVAGRTGARSGGGVEHVERGEAVAARRQRRVAPAARGCHLAQRCRVQPGVADRALRRAVGRALRRAQPQRGHAVTGTARGGRSRNRIAAPVAADDEDVAAREAG